MDKCEINMKPGWVCTRSTHLTGPCALVEDFDNVTQMPLGFGKYGTTLRELSPDTWRAAFCEDTGQLHEFKRVGLLRRRRCEKCELYSK